jgi:Fe2+ transport system protein FeoA/Mn-dependent DtxR family transcriptional regulator
MPGIGGLGASEGSRGNHMGMPALSRWFWPALSFLLAGLWLWTLLRHRQAARASRASAHGPLSQPLEVEDTLKAAYALQEGGREWRAEELAHAMGFPEAMADDIAASLIASGWAEKGAQTRMHLTSKGEARAQELIRAHRLWERYLVDQEGMPIEEVHAEAHRREHETTSEELEKLDADLGHPAWDPHGHVIPAPGCRVPSLSARPLLEEGTPQSRLRIVCLDDEPAPLLAQLIALGLMPGADIEVLERGSGLLRLRLANGNVVPVAAAAARHVSVVPAPALPVPLSELLVGSRARVAEVKGGGIHQRRMLDMGLVPGAEVTVMREAPLGDPVEYSIKGTAIAMRRRDAESIMVEEVQDG